MFRIRRVYDDILMVNREAIHHVQNILRAQFPFVRAEEVDQLPEKLRNPFKQHFRNILYVAENMRGRLLGFARLTLGTRHGYACAEPRGAG